MKRKIKGNKGSGVYIAVFISALFFCIVGPIIINILFKCKWGCKLLEAEWGADAALNYYGTILAATIAIVGVYISLRSSREQQKRDYIQSIKPYISLTAMKPFFNYNFNDLLNTKSYISGYSVNRNDFGERDPFEVFFTINSRDNIKISKEPDEEQEEWLRTPNLTQTGNKKELNVKLRNIQLDLKNLGKGAAIFLSFGVRNEKAKNDNISEWRNLFVGERIEVHIFYKQKNITQIVGEYSLKISYQDICCHPYEQCAKLIIDENSDAQLIYDGVQEPLM